MAERFDQKARPFLSLERIEFYRKISPAFSYVVHLIKK